MSSVGPCFLHGWRCPDDHLQCYKDCCLRGQTFCNHKAERCQKCQTRESQCGSPAVPWECDVYCLQNRIDLNATADSSGLVSPGYQYATFVLGAVVLLLVAFHIRGYVKHRRQRKTTASDKESDKASMTLSTVGSSAESLPDKGPERDDAGEPAEEPLLNAIMSTNITSLPPGSHPAALATAGRLNPNRRETSRLLERQLSQPLDETKEKEPLFDRTSAREQPSALSPQTPPPSPPEEGQGQNPKHPVPCHDPRLDNIIPTDNNMDVVQIHTGFCGHNISYSNNN